ncbi:MAG: chemotaxis-specific protein-glutamate methyltransferase CheB [Lachnospiraceae bacterium]|nr:chemotaxis-specific protein-glutamate methyltransferase CheB [Lachnospiraceae bacterium]
MGKKVLVIDDSALMRRAISDIIMADGQFTIVDGANDGGTALELLEGGKTYDVIVLDLYMPKMDGIQFLREMDYNGIRIPVIVTSAVTQKGAKETIQALEIGAFDFIQKPTNSVGNAFSDFRDELLVQLYCVCGLGEYRRKSENEKAPFSGSAQTSAPKPEKTSAPKPQKVPALQPKKTPVPEPKQAPPPVEKPKRAQHVLPEEKVEKTPTPQPRKKTGDKLAVIACSTGGPKALQSVIPMFPKNFPYPIVVVQHMPYGFTASLAERLDEMSPLPVKEAEDGDVLKNGYVYIAKGGRQCELIQQKTGKYLISENNKPARGGLRPCADIFFESLTDTAFDEIVCGILTGMGSDASKGISDVKKYIDVKVVAQDESTCVVYGMPRAAKEAGLVDDMVPLENVADAMMRKIGV